MTSTGIASAGASSKCTPAQIFVPITTRPMKRSAVALVQIVFELIIAVRISGAAAVVAELDDHISQRELRQEKDDADHYQGAHELGIVGDAMRVNRRRKPPCFRHEKIRDYYRERPYDGSE